MSFVKMFVFLAPARPGHPSQRGGQGRCANTPTASGRVAIICLSAEPFCNQRTGGGGVGGVDPLTLTHSDTCASHVLSASSKAGKVCRCRSGPSSSTTRFTRFVSIFPRPNIMNVNKLFIRRAFLLLSSNQLCCHCFPLQSTGLNVSGE